MQLEKLYWRDVRSEFFRLNQSLAKIIDELNPPDDCFFYKANYPYGDSIFQNGEFYLPISSTGKHSLASENTSKELKKELSYNPGAYPMMLILEHPVELFININNTSVPNLLLLPGDVLGITYVMQHTPSDDIELMQPTKSVWQISAGARSTFLLPKICDAKGHKRLEKKLNIVVKTPKEIFDHWQVFRAIYSKAGNGWETSVLFFSRGWFKYTQLPEWLPFKMYLYQTYVHKLKNYWNNLMDINMGLTEIHFQENLKPTLRVIDILRNIFAVAAGDSLGFQPAVDDSMLPCSLIQEAYINLYKLKGYYPTIMQPAYYGRLDQNPVYTSINMMSIDNLYDVLKVHSDAQLIEDVRYLFIKYAEILKLDKVNTDAFYLSEIIKNSNIEFFHYLRYKDTPLIDTKEIAQLDARFITEKYPSNQELAHAGTFIKACIKISPK
jgi:hypothetical protein